MSILTNYKKEKSVVISTEKPKTKAKKTRGYFAGRKMTSSQMEAEVIRMSKTMRIFEIAEHSGKDRRTIERILGKAKESGKITTSSSGRITLPVEELAKRDYDKLSSDELYEKYHPVKSWVDSRRAEAKGDSARMKNVNAQLGRLKVVCDTTRMNPHSLLSSGERGVSYGGLMAVMESFAVAMTESRVVYQNKKQPQPNPKKIASSYREYLMACRNFAVYNGIALPQFPPEHILSGKKVGFGKYAHIKMTKEEIDKCVTLLSETYGRDSIEVAMFVFYYLSGCRNNSIYTAKISTCKVESNGWITCRVYESKTRTSWKKFIPDDNPHFEIIEKWIESRKKDNKQYLFSYDGTYSQAFVVSLRSKYKEVYKIVGLAESYFAEHPVHCLRHVAAHYWLERTHLNHAAVAKIVGWKDIQTLITCYGEITDEQIFDIAMAGVGA